MKTFYPLIVATLIIAATITPSRAEEQETSLLTKKEKRTEKRQEKKQLFETKRINYRHDFRIGIGAPAIQIDHVGFFGPCGGPYPGETRTYTEYSPTYSIYYSYRVIKGLKIGGTLAYYRTQEKDATQNQDYSVIAMRNYNTWNASFDVRYEWFNRGVVTLYSDISASLKFVQKINSGRTDVIPRAGVTPLGITIGGKKLFGYIELFSFGPRGFFNGGIGYRF